MNGYLHPPEVALLPGKKPRRLFGKEDPSVPEPVWMFWRREKFIFIAANRTPDSTTGCQNTNTVYTCCVLLPA
jgi:hypothetical protein